MAEQNKDLNSGQSVATQDLNADVVNQQDLNNAGLVGQQGETLADGTSKDKSVKYSEFEKAVQARKKAEEDAAHAQRQLELIQANIPQQQPQQQVQAQTKTVAEQALSDLGLTADDLYGENLIRFQNRKDELERAYRQYQAVHLANQQFISSHTDFSQVVGSVNPSTGQIMAWSQEAMSLMQKKPYLAAAFQTAQGAYQAIMDERKLAELERKATVNQEHLNRQELDNASLPLGGSAAGGGGAGDNQNQSMLTREQVLEIERKLAAGETV